VVAQRARVMQRVVRHLAVGGGTEAGELDELELQRRNVNHRAWSDQEQVTNLTDIFRPIGHDLDFNQIRKRYERLRFMLSDEPCSQLPSRICAAESG
jgi:hypothetical protein